MAFYIQVGEDLKFHIDLDQDQILVDGKLIDWDIKTVDKDHFHVLAGTRSMDVLISTTNHNSKEYIISINDRKYPVKVGTELDELLQKMGMKDKADGAVSDVRSPMPGLVLDILVKEGETVEKGQSLIVLEAMKMENVIKASGNGTVKAIRVKIRDAVEKNHLLIEMA